MNKLFFGGLVVMFVFASESYAMEESPEELFFYAQGSRFTHPERALSNYKKLLDHLNSDQTALINVSPAIIWHQMGEALLKLNRKEDALEAFKTATNLKDSNSNNILKGDSLIKTFCATAETYIRLTKYKKASKFFNKACYLENPNPKEGRYVLSRKIRLNLKARIKSLNKKIFPNDTSLSSVASQNKMAIGYLLNNEDEEPSVIPSLTYDKPPLEICSKLCERAHHLRVKEKKYMEALEYYQAIVDMQDERGNVIKSELRRKLNREIRELKDLIGKKKTLSIGGAATDPLTSQKHIRSSGEMKERPSKRPRTQEQENSTAPLQQNVL